MKASQIVGPRRVRLVEVVEPKIEVEGQVKIKVELACLCGSDIPFFNTDLEGLQHQEPGQRFLQSHFLDYNCEEMYPLRPGFSLHECLGKVVASSSSRIRKGEFVMAKPELQTGYLEYFCISDQEVVPLPQEGVEKEAILMTQPLGTVVSACRKIGDVSGKETVVIGSGPMGLLLIHMLTNLGARSVIALDKLDYRLEAAVKMGASHTVKVGCENAANAIEEITSGKMANLVVEAVGHQNETMYDALHYVCDEGMILGFGAPDTLWFDKFPYHEFFRRRLRLVASVISEPLVDYALARDLIVQGRVDVSPLITHHFSFDQGQEAYETFADRRNGVIKALIRFER